MTYSELETEISNLFAASDWEAIIALITPANTATAVNCSGKPYEAPAFQPLTRPDDLLENYKTLRTNVENEPSPNAILANHFVPENILLAELGAEYQQSLTNAETVLTDQNRPTPQTEAVTLVTEYAVELAELQNPQPKEQC